MMMMMVDDANVCVCAFDQAKIFIHRVEHTHSMWCGANFLAST